MPRLECPGFLTVHHNRHDSLGQFSNRLEKYHRFKLIFQNIFRLFQKEWNNSLNLKRMKMKARLFRRQEPCEITFDVTSLFLGKSRGSLIHLLLQRRQVFVLIFIQTFTLILITVESRFSKVFGRHQNLY